VQEGDRLALDIAEPRELIDEDAEIFLFLLGIAGVPEHTDNGDVPGWLCS
jgi:hypothetical protein